MVIANVEYGGINEETSHRLRLPNAEVRLLPGRLVGIMSHCLNSHPVDEHAVAIGNSITWWRGGGMRK